MGTEAITPALEALVSPRLAMAVLEVEVMPDSAEATTATPTTGKPESNVGAAKSNHQSAMHETLNRIIVLAPKFLASKEEHAKVRLEFGRELRTLQELHAKPGWGTFVERLKALRSKIKISQSTAYALIAESEIADGLRQKADKKHAPKPAASLSKGRKDESNTREKSFTIVANDPTLGLALNNPEPLPALAETETHDAKVLVQLHIPSSQLKEWDDALVILQSRPGYESANQSELVVEAVTAFAAIMKIHQTQAQEQAEEQATQAPVEVVCAIDLKPLWQDSDVWLEKALDSSHYTECVRDEAVTVKDDGGVLFKALRRRTSFDKCERAFPVLATAHQDAAFRIVVSGHAKPGENGVSDVMGFLDGTERLVLSSAAKRHGALNTFSNSKLKSSRWYVR